MERLVMALIGIRSRLILAVAGVLAFAGGMTLQAWQTGATRGGVKWVPLGLFILLGSGPFLLYLLFIRSPVATTLTGTALLVAVAIVYALVFGSGDPEAGLAFVTLIPINYVIFLLGFAFDATVFTRTRSSKS
jgi:hypothetical protein